MEAQYIKISKSIRYQTFGEVTAPHLIIALHGYGQLVEYFIENFKEVDSKLHYVFTPEATHRFYLNGTSGRVGASWMTRELRLLDIEENNEYLDNCLNFILSKQNYKKITVIGFSQGGATAARWVAATEHKIDELILWASTFPEDVLPELDNPKMQAIYKIFALGSKDPYFEGYKFDEANHYYQSLGFKVVNYDGDHKIYSKVLKEMI